MLGSFWFILGSVGMPNLKPNWSGGIWWAPWLPQGVPGGPNGAMLVDFWDHVGVIFDVKIGPKTMPTTCVFPSMDVVRFGGVSGCLFVTCFDNFRGCRDRSRKNWIFCKSRKSLIFWKTRAMDLEKSCKFRVLEYVVFWVTFLASFL